MHPRRLASLAFATGCLLGFGAFAHAGESAANPQPTSNSSVAAPGPSVAAPGPSVAAPGSSVAAPGPSVAAPGPAGIPPTDKVEAVGPSPTVSLGKPRMVRGGALPKGTEAALALAQASIESCYRDAIAAGHEGSPRLEVRLELVAPGEVASAEINASTEASAKLRGCVRDAYADLPGAGAVGPAPVEVLVALAFDRPLPDDLVLSASSCASECDGDLSDELKNELRGRAMRTAHCFKRPASPGESATLKAGSVHVSVRIAGDGSVCGVTTGNDVFARPSLTSCIVETMSETFANAPAGCVDVTVPLVFKGS
jgi:hypothetical protein